MNRLSKTMMFTFGLLSVLIALFSYRFIVQGMATAFPFMDHHWPAAATRSLFYIHVITAPIALVIAPFQLSTKLRTNRPFIHRTLGKAYCVLVLMAGVSGLIIGYNAENGVVTQAGFMLLAVIWLWVTFVAYRKAVTGLFAEHKKWMIRSIALTFAGVTLRIWLPLQIVAGIPFEQAYTVVAWLCWVPNVLVVEYLLKNKIQSI